MPIVKSLGPQSTKCLAYIDAFLANPSTQTWVDLYDNCGHLQSICAYSLTGECGKCPFFLGRDHGSGVICEMHDYREFVPDPNPTFYPGTDDLYDAATQARNLAQNPPPDPHSLVGNRLQILIDGITKRRVKIMTGKW